MRVRMLRLLRLLRLLPVQVRMWVRRHRSVCRVALGVRVVVRVVRVVQVMLVMLVM